MGKCIGDQESYGINLYTKLPIAELSVPTVGDAADTEPAVLVLEVCSGSAHTPRAVWSVQCSVNFGKMPWAESCFPPPTP